MKIKLDIQNIQILTTDILRNKTTKKLDNMIYKNFIDLVEDPKLLHTYDEINKLLHRDKVQFYVYMYQNKIIGYLIGDILPLQNGYNKRNVFFINYIFVAKQFRSSGLGNFLLNFAINNATKYNLDGIMLICDTLNKKVYNWYIKRGFMLDIELRRYSRHDVFFKHID
jgi:ribosomal protein S18 acetylase RimI-like enzyme